MPDRVLNTLLESGPHYDAHPMRVTQTLEPTLPPKRKPKRKKEKTAEKTGRIIPVKAGDILIIQVESA